MMRELYHGTTGDNILGIMHTRSLRPGVDGTLFFSENRFESVLMHGADRRRGASFAVKMRVHLPPGVTTERIATPGVVDTLSVRTTFPILADVLELYVRQARASSVQVIRGAADIQRFLQK